MANETEKSAIQPAIGSEKSYLVIKNADRHTHPARLTRKLVITKNNLGRILL